MEFNTKEMILQNRMKKLKHYDENIIKYCNSKIGMKKTQNISTFISTTPKLGLFAVHFAVYLLYQYKKYISVQISTSGHPVNFSFRLCLLLSKSQNFLDIYCGR